MHRFGMLWNFNSLAQLLQGGPGPPWDASRCVLFVRSSREFAFKADEMRLDALDASLEMFIRPELILQNMNPDFFMLSHRHILNGFFTGLCVCGLSNDKITSTLLFLGLMASWNSFPVTCYSRISRPADVAFRISPMVLPGTPKWPQQNHDFWGWSWELHLRIYVVYYFLICLMVLSCFEIWN